MIKTGRYGEVRFSATGNGTTPPPTVVLSLNKWKLSCKTDKQNVTCFGDTNKVYVPGMPDVSGNVAGFWNSDELVLFTAAMNNDVPGWLELVPNKNEATFVFAGPAYLDADIDASVEAAPAVTGDFMAAGSWTIPQTGGGVTGLIGDRRAA
jgi:hypothetical protein